MISKFQERFQFRDILHKKISAMNINLQRTCKNEGHGNA
jgi:hypothetical protein